MKKIILIVLSLYGYSASVFGYTVPNFKNYPATLFQGVKQPLKLDQKSQRYRTLFKNLTQQPMNAAGHYVAKTFGCGGGCSSLAIYNAKSGRGFLLPTYFSDCYSKQHGVVMNDIVFEKDSRLLIATGSRNGKIEQCEKVYYLLDGDTIKEIQQHWIYQQ